MQTQQELAQLQLALPLSVAGTVPLSHGCLVNLLLTAGAPAV